MRLRGLLFLVFFLLALWPASAVHAEERWNKDIEGHTVWTAKKQPYIVTSSIEIKQGATLVIEPGVTVRLLPNVNLEVYGQLRATGRPRAGPFHSRGRTQGRTLGLHQSSERRQCQLEYGDCSPCKGRSIDAFGWGTGSAVYTSVFRDNEIAIHKTE